MYYDSIGYERQGNSWVTLFDAEALTGQKLAYDVVDAANGEVVIEAGKKITRRVLKKADEAGIEKMLLSNEAAH